MPQDPPPPGVGDAAPLFGLRSVQGPTVELAAYRGRRNVVLWFSRGFTCPFCRAYMDGIGQGYPELRAIDTEVIQVAPNLLESARTFFRDAASPFPFVCDPDKRLYAVYGLGDRGALEATRTALVSFSHAFTHGDAGPQVRGAWLDVMNRNFLRRLHHHAMTAVEQPEESDLRHRGDGGGHLLEGDGPCPPAPRPADPRRGPVHGRARLGPPRSRQDRGGAGPPEGADRRRRTRHLPRVFDKFYRVHDPAAKDIPGTGLGLAIAKSIVDSHDGRILVESTEGAGSVFTVVLPESREA